MVQEIFKNISYRSSGGPFIRQSRSKYARGHYEEHFCEIISNLDQWFRCHLTDFLPRALAAIRLSRAEPFLKIWWRALWGAFLRNYLIWTSGSGKDVI